VKIQIELEDGNGVIFDGFIQAKATLPVRPSALSPLYITVERQCFVSVSYAIC